MHTCTRRSVGASWSERNQYQFLGPSRVTPRASRLPQTSGMAAVQSLRHAKASHDDGLVDKGRRRPLPLAAGPAAS